MNKIRVSVNYETNELQCIAKYTIELHWLADLWTLKIENIHKYTHADGFVLILF